MKNIFIPMQIRVKRKQQTLKDVSRATGISVSFLSDIERGRTLPSIKTLIELANYLDAEISEFFVIFEDA